MNKLSVIGLWFAFSYVLAFRRIYPYHRILTINEDVGNPVFLTPYIESGDIQGGQNASEVRGFFGDVRSYAGFFTVNKKFNSNLYFWYFPAEKSPDTAPVALWLQGGPGASSLYGLFDENGPFFVTKEGTLKRREHSWTQVLNVIYIDNPVGTGYSFTDNVEGYARNEVDVGNDLYSALIQFFQLFPHLKNNDFYLTGESYAGKYIPAIAYRIHKNNQISEQKINLQGMTIGNGFCDPINQMNYGDYLKEIGLIDDEQRIIFKYYQENITEDILEGNYERAFYTSDKLLDGDLITTKSVFQNFTGFSFYFNYLYNAENSPNGDSGVFVQKPVIRKKIHVGNAIYHSGEKVETFLKSDVMQSVKPWIEELLEHYRILFYNGQLDIIVAYPLTVNFLQTLQWSGADIYKTAPRKEWRVGSDLAGYSKTAKGMTEVLVRNSGHMVPQDQPSWAFDLITKFIFQKSL